MAQLNGRLLPLLLVAGTHFLPFQIVHQWPIARQGKSTLIEFDGCTNVHQGAVAEKNVAVVGAVLTHQNTSTA